MRRQFTKTIKMATILLALTCSVKANDKRHCEVNCILMSAPSDQNCALENPPLIRCGNFEEFKDHDNRLNHSYSTLRKMLNKAEQENLRKIQISWISWRDETCDDLETEANCDNGMCTGVAHDSCMVALTERRDNELEIFKKNITKAKASNFSFSRMLPNNETFELP
jgi:uncharacterized protein YecT (DUF1311 family)